MQVAFYRGTTVAEGVRGALCQPKSYRLLENCTNISKSQNRIRNDAIFDIDVTSYQWYVVIYLLHRFRDIITLRRK